MNSHCVSCWTALNDSDTVCGSCKSQKPDVGWLQTDFRGRRIAGGRYELLEPLGFGGFGCVARARQWCNDVSLGTVAIKFPHPEVAHMVEHAAFFREAEAVRKIQHPGIVVLHDAFVDHGIPFLVMELVESFTPLVSNLPKGETALWIGIQVADAMDALHHKGVVHCDLKPDNIATRMWLSDYRPFVKVLDFGLATVWKKRLGYSGGAGTPGFAPPDQVNGDITPKCDVFSLGVILYLMFSGTLPYKPELFFDPSRFANEPVPPTLENVPPELDVIIRECLRVDPDGRYPRMPTAPLLDILKTTSADLSDSNIDTDAMLRQAKDLFIRAGLSKGHDQRQLYIRSAELFEELAQHGKLPKAYKDHARKARVFAEKAGGGLFGGLFG